MGETQPLPQIFIAAALFPEAATFLRRHGCTVESDTFQGIDKHLTRTTVTLPQGSTRRLLTKAASEHWRITLPGSVSFKQVYDPGTGTSALSIPVARDQEEDNDEQ